MNTNSTIENHYTNNKLFKGDNLLVLNALKQQHAETIKMIYIDPPYNTSTTFDNIKHTSEQQKVEYNSNPMGFIATGSWLNFLRVTLSLCKDLLTNDGSIWISSHDSNVHYLRMLCDDIFHEGNFVSFIDVYHPDRISKLKGDFLYNPKSYLLVYAKDINNFLINKTSDKTNHLVSSNQDVRQELKKLGIHFPEAKSEKILAVITAKDDWILDPFLGSGTTAAVAHKMQRKWIGIEIHETLMKKYCIPRLTKVVKEELGGISSQYGWKGGGGFRHFDSIQDYQIYAQIKQIVLLFKSKTKCDDLTQFHKHKNKAQKQGQFLGCLAEHLLTYFLNNTKDIVNVATDIIGWGINIENPQQNTHLYNHLEKEINDSSTKLRTMVANYIFFEEDTDIGKAPSVIDKQIDICTWYDGNPPKSQFPMSKGIQLKVTKNDDLFILRKQKISDKNDYFQFFNGETDNLDKVLVPTTSNSLCRDDCTYNVNLKKIDSFIEEASKRIKSEKFEEFLQNLPIIGPFYTVPIIVFNIGNADFNTQILKYKNTKKMFFDALRDIGANARVEFQKCDEKSRKDILQRKITIIDKLETFRSMTRPIINAEEKFPKVYKILNYLHNMFDELSEDMTFETVFETPEIIAFFNDDL